jgi:hypothetical protein
MNRVSLVCTVHGPMELASELCAILERIQPEVIFLEVPPEALKDYLKNSQNVEAEAVRQYQLAHQVEPVPVDLPAPNQDFVNGIPSFFERIEKECRDFCRLIDSNRLYVETYGFAYLNSEYSSKVWSDIYEEMLRTIRRMDDPTLVAFYESWKETNGLREKAMMENIQKYWRENAFDKGVFLVGAAHRQAIIDISKEQSGNRWDFADHCAQQSAA